MTGKNHVDSIKVSRDKDSMSKEEPMIVVPKETVFSKSSQMRLHAVTIVGLMIRPAIGYVSSGTQITDLRAH